MDFRLSLLFKGLDRAHGVYNIEGSKGAKRVGRALTKKEPVTEALWKQHESGKIGLGIIPIRDDNTCFFGAIDIDSYEDFDPVEIANMVEQQDWPLAVCRSKSGGAHVFMFTSEAVPAMLMRTKLAKMAACLGYPTAEIFPKQDKMRSAEDIGNWINMPYFDSEATVRFCIRKGEALTLQEFLQFSRTIRISRSKLEQLEIGSNEFDDAPPCLEHFTTVGFPRGSMNHALFDMGVYAKMKWPDNWHAKLHEYNNRFMGPGSQDEVSQIIKSLERKKYIYKCQEQPICGKCNKTVCNERKYGIASEASPYKSTNARKKEGRPCVLDEVDPPVECYMPPPGSNDEPYWVFRFHGEPVDVTVEMVTSQIKFLREYLKRFHKVALPVDETRWMILINNLLETAEIIEMAPDAGPEGQLWLHLETFCTGKVQARSQDELLLGRPFTDNGRTYFRSPDFIRHLDTNRFKEFKERAIYAILRRKGAKHHKFMLKGKCVACWSIPEFTQQNEDFDHPDVTREEF